LSSRHQVQIFTQMPLMKLIFADDAASSQNPNIRFIICAYPTAILQAWLNTPQSDFSSGTLTQQCNNKEIET
jgi:hypothetical protein